MKKPYLHLFVTGLLISASLMSHSATEGLQRGSVIAEVNGDRLTVADFQAYIRMRMRDAKQPQNLSQEQRQKIFAEYINRELLFQEAVKKGLQHNEIIKAEIENQQRNIIVSFALRQLMQSPINEKDIRAVYDKEIAIPGKEYKTRHILVKSEAQAKKIIKELDRGISFMQLATKLSIDASAKKGGELGWFSPEQMVEPYASATQKLTNGTYTRTPVQTRFGWHVIRLDGTREVAPPAYADVKKSIVSQINTRRIAAYINDLRQKANIAISTNAGITPKQDETAEKPAQ